MFQKKLPLVGIEALGNFIVIYALLASGGSQNWGACLGQNQS
jgi:hypothetical protein